MSGMYWEHCVEYTCSLMLLFFFPLLQYFLVSRSNKNICFTHHTHITHVHLLRYEDNPDLKYTQVGVIQITNPTVDSNSSLLLSSDSLYLTITGTGFNSAEPVSSGNSINFTTARGTGLGVTGVVSDVPSAYSLTFTFYQMSACNYGSLTAQATVVGGTEVVVQEDTSIVVTIVASSPTVEESLETLSSDTTLLTIKGSGFEVTTSLNEIETSASNSDIPISGAIQESSFTHIIYSFEQLLPIQENGTIQAKLRSKCCTDIAPYCDDSEVSAEDLWSDLVDIAKIVAAHPTIEVSNFDLSSDSSTITVTGKGFSNLDGYNTIEFENCYATSSSTCGDEVKAIESNATSNEVVFQFTHLAPTNENSDTQNLYATLRVFSTWSTGSTPISVAKIHAAIPTLTTDVTTILNSDALKLTMMGKGFDATTPTNNVAVFSNTAVEGSFIASTLTQIVLSFSSLAPSDQGVLDALIVVSSTWSSSVQTVIKIQAADPSITESDISLNSDSETLTIMGRGFDSGVPTNNAVSFYTDTSPDISGTVITVSLTHLVVSFDSVLRVTNVGCLNATTIVTNSSGSEITSSSSEEIVAYIKEQTPKVNTRSGNLSSAATKLTIFGEGFDALTVSNNEFNFYTPSDSSDVVADIMNVSWTHMIFSFSALSPTNWGCCLQIEVRTSHSNVTCGNDSSSEWSDQYNIADVYIETPIIESDTTTLYTSSRTLTIFGDGFDYVNPTVNTVTFTQSSGEDVKGTVLTSTRTAIIVSFTALEHDNAGVLYAYVTIADDSIYRRRLDDDDDVISNEKEVNENTLRRRRMNDDDDTEIQEFQSRRRELIIADSTNGLQSEETAVATIEATAPLIDTDTVTLIKSTDTLLTIRGFGFGLETDQQPNYVTLTPASGNQAYTPTGSVQSSSVSSLVFSFSALNPENAGTMAAVVSLNSMVSNQATVITVIPCPVVSATTQLLDSDSNEITISGRYFYTGDPSLNYVSFPADDATTPDATGVVYSASSTQIVASFYQLSQHNYGALDVVVTRDKSTVSLLDNADADQIEYIGDLDSESRTVATINPILTVIDSSTSIISSDSLYLTITGTGFSGTNMTTNVLTFDAAGGTTVRGVATSSSRTNLVLQFSKLATSNAGDLYVSNEVQTSQDNYTSSSQQVATVVATDPYFLGNESMYISSDSTLLTLKGTGFDASDPSRQSIDFSINSSSSTYEVTGEVMTASMTQLVIQFHTMGASNEGTLYATITIDDTYSTSSEIACQVVGTNPKLTTCGDDSTDCMVSEESSELFTLIGLGFAQTDSTNCTSMNTVELWPLDSTQPDLSYTVVNCTRTTLTMSWTEEPNSCNSGFFYGRVTVDSNTTDDVYVGYLSDNITGVTQVEVTEQSENNISTTTPNMTVIGCGFHSTTSDASEASYNVLTFNMSHTVDGNEYPVRGYVSETTDNTVTKIIIVFSVLSPANSGDLYLQVYNAAEEVSSSYGLVGTITSTSQTLDVSSANLSSTSSSLILTGYGFDGYQDTCRNAFEISAENNNDVNPILGEIKEWTYSQLQIDFSAISPLNYGDLTCRIGVVCTDVSDIETCDYITEETIVSYVVATAATIDESDTTIETDISGSFTVSGAGFDATYVSNNDIVFSTGNSDWVVLSGYDCNVSSSESTTSYVEDSDECQSLCNASSVCLQYVFMSNSSSSDNSTCTLYETTSMSTNTLPTLSSSDNVTCGYLRPDIGATIIRSSISSLIMTFDQMGPIHASNGAVDLMLMIDVEGSPGYSEVTTISSLSAAQIEISDSRTDTISTLSSHVTIHGSGFDDSFPRYNEIEFTSSSLVSGYVSDSSRTTLVLSLWKLSYSLNANVACVVDHFLSDVSDMSLSDISSTSSTCFQIEPTNPFVTESTEMVMTDTEKLTILGEGFETNTTLNMLTFTTRRGDTFELSECLTATRTMLIVDVSNILTATYWGNISVVVSIEGSDGEMYNSSSTVISDLRIAKPIISENTTCVVTTTEKNVTLTGYSFDMDLDQNNVTSYVQCTDDDGTTSTSIVLGAASSIEDDSLDYLVFDFYDLAPRHSGCDLYFNIQVASNPSEPDSTLSCFDSDSDSECMISDDVNVCTVQAADPSIDTSSEDLSVNVKKLTIKGSGFDATMLTNNIISFNSSSNDYEVTASVHKGTSK